MKTNRLSRILLFLIFWTTISCLPSQSVEETPMPIVGTKPPILPSPTKPEPTPILVPTLSPEIALQTFINLIENDALCSLPCWLNITPGLSTHADAYLKWAGFLTLLGTTKTEPRDFSYYFKHSENDEDFSIITRYYLQPTSDTIESMYITTQTLRTTEDGIRDDVYDSIVYKKILNSYLLSSILTKYGQPDQILLSMNIGVAEATSPSYFNIWLFYPSRGAVINYEGEAIIQNNIAKGCPSNTFVTLWLAIPGSTNLHSETLDEEIWLSSSQYYKSMVDAIGITAEEFYNEFKDTNNGCLESPLDIWQ